MKIKNHLLREFRQKGRLNSDFDGLPVFLQAILIDINEKYGFEIKKIEIKYLIDLKNNQHD